VTPGRLGYPLIAAVSLLAAATVADAEEDGASPVSLFSDICLETKGQIDAAAAAARAAGLGDGVVGTNDEARAAALAYAAAEVRRRLGATRVDTTEAHSFRSQGGDTSVTSLHLRFASGQRKNGQRVTFSECTVDALRGPSSGHSGSAYAGELDARLSRVASGQIARSGGITENGGMAEWRWTEGATGRGVSLHIQVRRGADGVQSTLDYMILAATQ